MRGSGSRRATWLRLLAAVVMAVGIASCAADSLSLAPGDARTPYVNPDAPPPPGSRAADFELNGNPSLPIDLAKPTIDARHVYSLPELIDIAEMSNPLTAAAWERARQAALGVGIAKSAYLPLITANALAGYQEIGQTNPALDTSLSGPVQIDLAISGPPRTITTTAKETQGAVALNWLLLDFGGRDATLAAAKDFSHAANVEFNGAHQKLIYEVAIAFYQFSAARAQLAIARETLGNGRFLLAAATARNSRGIGTEIEVAQARQLLAQAQLGLAESEGLQRDAYHSLLMAMGVSPTVVVGVEDVSGRALPGAVASNLDAMIEAALRRRPDVQAAFARLSADRHNVERAQSDFLPRVALNGAVSKTVGDVSVHDPLFNLTTSGPVNAPSADVLLSLTMPIYDGGLRDAQLRMANAQASAAEHELTQIENVGARQIVVAYDTLRTSLAAHAAASELTRAALITADAARESYSRGLMTLTDAITAQTGLLGARLAKAKAHSDALTAAATLAFTTGTLGSRETLGK